MTVLSQSPANFLPGGFPLSPQTPRRQFCGASIYKGATEVPTQPSDNRTLLFNPCCPERPAVHLDVMMTVAQPPKPQPSRSARICSPMKDGKPIMEEGSPGGRNLGLQPGVREGRMLVLSSLSPFYSTHGSQPMEGTTHLRLSSYLP